MKGVPETAWSRRHILGGLAGLSVLSLPSLARGQGGNGQAGNGQPGTGQAGGGAVLTEDGYRLLRAQPAASALRGDDQPSTPTLGYNGRTPGPLLRVAQGQEIKVRLQNGLTEPTAIHWAGVRQPNRLDGTPHLTQRPVAPGEQHDYVVQPRDAGTFWYHATGLAVDQWARGLYGVLIVEEPQPAAVDREVVLVFDEWRLTSEGVYDPARGEADYFTVNGRPHVTIGTRSNERLRLRLLNASVSRMLGLRIDGHPMTVMAVDGQPSEPFAARDSRVLLGPGNRIDVFLDAILAPGVAAPIVMETETGAIPIARLVYDQNAGPRPQPLAPPTQPLRANPLPAQMDFARALKLTLPLDMNAKRGTVRDAGGRPIAGEAGSALWVQAAAALQGGLGAPLFRVPRGRTVMLAFVNPTAQLQALHVHGHSFRLLDALDDGWKPYWLDTVVVAPKQTVRIAFVADAPGKWMIYSLLVRPQADGMATWFEVT